MSACTGANSAFFFACQPRRLHKHLSGRYKLRLCVLDISSGLLLLLLTSEFTYCTDLLQEGRQTNKSQMCFVVSFISHIMAQETC